MGPDWWMPPDEYDSYIDPIAGMLRDNATDDAIMRYLEWAVSGAWGVSPLRTLAT